MFAVELLANSAVVCIVTLCFQKQPPELFYKKSVLRYFTKFTGKHLCHGLFLNKAAGLRPATLLKKKLWYRCLPVNFVKLLRTLFLQDTSGRLLLCFEHAQIFHNFTFTYHLRYYMIMIIVEAVNNVLTSYIRLCNYVKLNSNEPIKVAHLQINQC